LDAPIPSAAPTEPDSNSKEAEMIVTFVMLLVLAGLFVLGLAMHEGGG
jgi:hypothetical protein